MSTSPQQLSAGQFRGRRELRVSPQAAARSARSKTRSSPQAAARSARSKTRSEGARSDRSSRSATSQNSEVERAGNEWQQNTTADHCSNCDCGVKFSLFTRRHHCRSCGLIFCSRCSPLRDVDDSILPYRDAKRKAKAEAEAEAAADGSPAPPKKKQRTSKSPKVPKGSSKKAALAKRTQQRGGNTATHQLKPPKLTKSPRGSPPTGSGVI